MFCCVSEKRGSEVAPCLGRRPAQRHLGTLGITPLPVSWSRSRHQVRCLPSEIDTVGSSTSNRICFGLSTFFGVRRQDDIGQVEIRQDSVYAGEDVYIVAQQATQVYYLPWACQDDKRLKGWFLVHSVSPRGKLPVPTDDDYNFDPTADNGEFYIPEGLNGHLSIDIESLMDMEVDNEVDEDEGEVVQDPEDIIMLEKWRACRELGVEDSTAQARKDFQWSDSDDDDDDDDDSDDVEPTTIVRGDAF